MDRTQLFKDIDELLGLDEGTLKGAEPLESLGWDSLATIGFMALVDERFGIDLQPLKIAACSTAEDLLALLGSRVQVESAQ